MINIHYALYIYLAEPRKKDSLALAAKEKEQFISQYLATSSTAAIKRSFHENMKKHRPHARKFSDGLKFQNVNVA